MSKSPTVSVIIPAYNVAPFITETLDSLFAQTYCDFEAVVIDDGSTDDTEKKLEPYRDRIVYLKQENKGLASARNAGIRAARGRYISLLDGDDIWMPEYLQTLIDILETDRELSAVYPNAWFFGSPRFDGRLYQDVLPVIDPVTFDNVLRRECNIFIAVIMRREALNDAGLFDENLEGHGAEDFELWLRMLQRGHRFKFSTRPLVKYRWRHNSLSNDGVGLLKCAISVYEKYHRSELTTPAQRAWIDKKLPDLQAQLNLAYFKELMKSHKYTEAAPRLALANEHYRSPKLTLMRAALRFTPGLVRQWALK